MKSMGTSVSCFASDLSAAVSTKANSIIEETGYGYLYSLHCAKGSLLKPPIVRLGREHEGRSYGRNCLCLPDFSCRQKAYSFNKGKSLCHTAWFIVHSSIMGKDLLISS